MISTLKYFIGSCLALVLLAQAALAQSDLVGPPASNGTAGKVEPGTDDSLKKMAKDLESLKVRLNILEDTLFSTGPRNKSDLDKLSESVQSLQIKVGKLQDEVITVRDTFFTKNGINQTGNSVPKKLPEETTAQKTEVNLPQDQFSVLSKKLDDLTKINLQVQANTRDLNDLKRKHDAMQMDVIQAQNDIGKLQQDMVRLRNQIEGTRNYNETGREDLQRRSSAALPLPPEQQGAAARPLPLLGTIKLTNSYVMPVSVVVDGRMYTLGTSETLSLDRLPGAFTYEVLGIQANTLRTVSAGETLTIRVVSR